MDTTCALWSAATFGPAVQGYLAHKKPQPPKDPTVGLCIGPYGGPREFAVSYERGTPVEVQRLLAADGVDINEIHPRYPFPLPPSIHVQGYLAHVKHPPP